MIPHIVKIRSLHTIAITFSFVQVHLRLCYTITLIKKSYSLALKEGPEPYLENVIETGLFDTITLAT